jgi:hypothetical protein
MAAAHDVFDRFQPPAKTAGVPACMPQGCLFQSLQALIRRQIAVLAAEYALLQLLKVLALGTGGVAAVG